MFRTRFYACPRHNDHESAVTPCLAPNAAQRLREMGFRSRTHGSEVLTDAPWDVVDAVRESQDQLSGGQIHEELRQRGALGSGWPF